jgi:hypothetical protein
MLYELDEVINHCIRLSVYITTPSIMLHVAPTIFVIIYYNILSL